MYASLITFQNYCLSVLKIAIINCLNKIMTQISCPVGRRESCSFFQESALYKMDEHAKISESQSKCKKSFEWTNKIAFSCLRAIESLNPEKRLKSVNNYLKDVIPRLFRVERTYLKLIIHDYSLSF